MTTDNSQIPEDEAESQADGIENQVNQQEQLKEVRAFLAQMAMDELSRDKREDYLEFFVEDCSTCTSDSLNKIEKWEAANGVSCKLYFSLSDAANITDLDQAALLNAGGREAILLCAPLPPGVKVSPFYGGAIGDPIPELQLLVLSDADCRSIELNGSATQSDFERAYAFPFSETICVFPGYRNCNYMYEDATWKTCVDNNPVSINLVNDRLFITRAGLCSFLDSQLASIKGEHALQPERKIVPGKVSPNSKTPQEFIDALNRLLEIISERASAKGIKFDRNEMPGTKENLRELAEKIDPLNFSKSKQTFDDYLRGICKFKKGRLPTNATNPYADLFPEHLKSPL